MIRERGGGRSILEMNGVVIGDALMDNIADRDGYRFHDVFHFAHKDGVLGTHTRALADEARLFASSSWLLFCGAPRGERPRRDFKAVDCPK